MMRPDTHETSEVSAPMSDLLRNHNLPGEPSIDAFDDTAVASELEQDEDLLLEMPGKAPPLQLTPRMIEYLKSDRGFGSANPWGRRLGDAASKCVHLWERDYGGRQGPDAAVLALRQAILRGEVERENRRRSSAGKSVLPVAVTVRARLEAWKVSHADAYDTPRPRRFYDQLKHDRPERLRAFENLIFSWLQSEFGKEIGHDSEGRVRRVGTMSVDVVSGRLRQGPASGLDSLAAQLEGGKKR